MTDLSNENPVHVFRPVLKELNIQHLSENPSFVRISRHRQLLFSGPGDCIIVVQRTHLKNVKGLFSTSYNKAQNIFAFMISIDGNLFKDVHLKTELKEK